VASGLADLILCVSSWVVQPLGVTLFIVATRVRFPN
jgi:type IV secretory pathway TrbD component